MNPFKSIPGGKSDEDGAEKPEPQEPAPPPGSLCPILGAVAVPKVNPAAARLIHRPDVNPLDVFQPGITIMGCQREACSFWDAEEGDCLLKVAAQAQIDTAAILEEVKVALEPLAHFFGKK